MAHSSEIISKIWNGVIMNKLECVHIGQKIRKELYCHKHSIVWFAEQLGCSRTNVYKIFSNAYINTYLLFKISKILHYNFFQCYSDFFEQNEKM